MLAAGFFDSESHLSQRLGLRGHIVGVVRNHRRRKVVVAFQHSRAWMLEVKGLLMMALVVLTIEWSQLENVASVELGAVGHHLEAVLLEIFV